MRSVWKYRAVVPLIAVIVATAGCGGTSRSSTQPSSKPSIPSSTTSIAATTTSTTIPPPDLHAEPLSISDMPAGWSVDNSSGSGSGTPDCLKPLTKSSGSIGRAQVSSHGGSNQIPSFDENLAYFPPGVAHLAFLNYGRVLAACKQIWFSAGGKTFAGTVGEMSFPTVGDESRAFQVNLSTTVQGLTLTAGIDVVEVRRGNTAMTFLLLDLGTPDLGLLRQFSDKGIAKLGIGTA